MSKRPRRNHAPAFKAKVALEDAFTLCFCKCHMKCYTPVHKPALLPLSVDNPICMIFFVFRISKLRMTDIAEALRTAKISSLPL